MKSEFDELFELMRINQLLMQHHQNDIISGKVIFGCDEKENEQSHSTWLFDEPTLVKIKASHFRDMLLSLIDTLIAYRSTFKLPNSRDGIISFVNSHASIEWIEDGKSHNTIKSIRETNKNG